MEDREIIELYWQRSQEAIGQTDIKYGGMCRGISYNILANHEDSEECVSDTYLAIGGPISSSGAFWYDDQGYRHGYKEDENGNLVGYEDQPIRRPQD